ncbi:hypothetical protein H6P81_002951 [Aristolochia fimbriata]|uniref:Uncharacterized protein n=1 Tax=Aristolochia fimbriata TaxID=158543 RepID=A0AAV7FBY2_ARIFI|nr:hypothetical protein H6P81_002951 [Aristolochia fimbriata]
MPGISSITRFLKGQLLDYWGLGNELRGDGYDLDIIVLIDQLYSNSTYVPKVLATDGFWDQTPSFSKLQAPMSSMASRTIFTDSDPVAKMRVANTNHGLASVPSLGAP